MRWGEVGKGDPGIDEEQHPGNEEKAGGPQVFRLVAQRGVEGQCDQGNEKAER